MQNRVDNVMVRCHIYWFVFIISKAGKRLESGIRACFYLPIPSVIIQGFNKLWNAGIGAFWSQSWSRKFHDLHFYTTTNIQLEKSFFSDALHLRCITWYGGKYVYLWSDSLVCWKKRWTNVSVGILNKDIISYIFHWVGEH